MRKITSVILMVAFIAVSITGVQMVVAPKNQPQKVPQQMIAIPDSEKPIARAGTFYPKKAHEWAGYLFIGAGLVHIVFNKRPMISYFKLIKSI